MRVTQNIGFLRFLLLLDFFLHDTIVTKKITASLLQGYLHLSLVKWKKNNSGLIFIIGENIPKLITNKINPELESQLEKINSN